MVNFFQDDTRGAARKLLIITALGIFRVAKTPTLKMSNSLLLSCLQVALAEAVLWRWQAEQRHGPRRIAKHPELSGLLPLPAYKVQSSELSLLCLNDLRVRGAEKDLAAAVAGRNSYIETKETKMELSWKPRNPRWNPRWSSDGSKGIRDGIQDGIPGGTQMESKEAKEAKIDSQNRNQGIPRSKPSNPR